MWCVLPPDFFGESSSSHESSCCSVSEMFVVAFDPRSCEMWFYGPTGFVPYEVESTELPCVEMSLDWYGGHREHLVPATIRAGRARAEQAV